MSRHILSPCNMTYLYAQSWNNIEPRPPSIYVYCHQIPSSIIPGDDIIINLEGISHPSRVVDVRVNDGLPEVLVNIWVRESSLRGTDAVPQLDRVRFSNVMGMVGVVRSNWIVWVKPETIVDFAFIFHCDSVQNGMYANSHGMSNAFYTHYKLFTLEGRNLVSVYETNNHVPFAHLNVSYFFPESSHHRVFKFLTQMKRNADSVLWTERKFKNANGIGRSLPLFVNNECWTYFTNKLQKNPSFAGYNFTPSRSSWLVRTFFHDLASQAISIPTNIHTIVAEESSRFCCLRSIFGTGYGFGVRRPRDTKNSGLSSLSITDRINVLDFFSSGAEDGISAIDPNALDAPEISNKVIFIYNLVTSFVTIRYYYRYVRVGSARGQELLQTINHRLAVINEAIDIIAEGTTFHYQGSMYRTLPHFHHMAEVHTINMMDGSSHNFPPEQVRELIMAHNDTNMDIDL